MLIGPIIISFASPFFITLGALSFMLLWHTLRRSHKSFVPQSHIMRCESSRKKLLRIAHRIIVSLCVASLILFLFAALNPRIVRLFSETSEARKILVLFDVSGSATIGFDDTSSPLPSYSKTRMGRAGVFIQELVEKRPGDAFGIVFFDDEQYVSRDFTTDASQITEVLNPVNLVGSFNIKNPPEAVRLKEDAVHRGTRAIDGIRFAREFIMSHKDYSGNEIIVFVGDFERQSGGIDAQIPVELERIKKEDGIKSYAVGVLSDYIPRTEKEKRELAKKKIGIFEGTSITLYRVEGVGEIEKIAARVAGDIPPSRIEETSVVRYSLAPWLLIAGFISMCIVAILNEKFPKIP